MERPTKTEYHNYKPLGAFITDNWVKGILVFNFDWPERHIVCHRISYKTERREDAIGVWHVKTKL